MSSAVFQKQPSEVRSVDVNFDRWARGANDNDYVTSATVSVTAGNTGDPNDLVIGPGALPDFTILPGLESGIAAQRVKVWVGAGLTGVRYKVTLIATMHSGNVLETDFTIAVRDR